MRRDTRLLKALAWSVSITAGVLGAWLAVTVALVQSTFTPEEAAAAAALLDPRLALLVLAGPVAARGLRGPLRPPQPPLPGPPAPAPGPGRAPAGHQTPDHLDAPTKRRGGGPSPNPPAKARAPRAVPWARARAVDWPAPRARREGISPSAITKCRKLRRDRSLSALAPQRPGPKPAPRDPVQEELAQLRAENARLQARLSQAEMIIDVQKKVAALLGASTSTMQKAER